MPYERPLPRMHYRVLFLLTLLIAFILGSIIISNALLTSNQQPLDRRYTPCLKVLLLKEADQQDIQQLCHGIDLPYILARLTQILSADELPEPDSYSTNLAEQTCKVFRDITSESKQDLTSCLVKPFPDIISACGGNVPVLVSNHSVHREKSSSVSKQAATNTETLVQDTYVAVLNTVSSKRERSIPVANTTASASKDKHAVVPNVVHYVWFGGPFQISFLNYLSLLSVHKFLKPDYIFLHGDSAPSGQWWTKALNSIPNIHLVMRARPLTICGKTSAHMQHYADVARLEILLDYGGIYLDWDVLALRPFEPLLKYDVTLGRETPDALANGIILAKRAAPFLRIWLETYHTFQPEQWSAHSTHMPHKLLAVVPHLVHVEDTSLIGVPSKHAKLMFRGHYPWRNNYAMHVWKRKGLVPQNSVQVKNISSTLGEIMRHVLEAV